MASFQALQPGGGQSRWAVKTGAMLLSENEPQPGSKSRKPQKLTTGPVMGSLFF